MNIDANFILSALGACAWIPQIIDYFNKKSEKPQLKIFVQKQIEIGYNTLGQIINLDIAILGEKKRCLIKSIELELEHEKGAKSRYTWEWYEEALYQSEIPTLGNSSTKKNQKAIAINIPQDSLIERQIGFHLNGYKTKQNELQKHLNKKIDAYLNTDNYIQNVKVDAHYNQLIELNKTEFAWDVGKYNLKIIAHTENDVKFDTEVKFELSLIDVEKLKSNIEICNTLLEMAYSLIPSDDMPSTKWVNIDKIT